MNFNQKVIFIAEMNDPKDDATSTQIMTMNLLYGFRQITDKLYFIALIKPNANKDNIGEYYSKYCDKLLFLNREEDKINKYGLLFQMLKKTKHISKNNIPNEIVELITDNTIVVSQSPAIDAAILACSLKKAYKTIRYIQYWGDPIALSLITPSEYNYKRSLFKHIEKKLHSYADKIVFGTYSLYNAQLTIFPEIGGISTSVEVAHCPNDNDLTDVKAEEKKLTLGYFGNYYSNIRDITALYKAICLLPEVDLTICGSGDIELRSTENIHVFSRIPQSEVHSKENSVDVEVCFLNKVGIQIPGKVFYQTNTDKIIIVVLDGPVKNLIKTELEKSNRFVFAENNIDSIKECVKNILSGLIQVNADAKEYYSPAVISQQIIS